MVTMHVEVDALAGAIFQRTTRSIAEGLVDGLAFAGEEGRHELSPPQHADLVDAALQSVAGLEEAIKRTLVDGLERWSDEPRHDEREEDHA